MAIYIHPTKTGTVFLRNFDQGIFDRMGAVPDPSDPSDPCFRVSVPTITGVSGIPDIEVPAYFAQPESIFQKKVYPFISVVRDDAVPNLQRWMSVGQLEYRSGVSGSGVVINGVSGFTSYERKFQPYPHDITYTISAWDRYENGVQPILYKLLKAFTPTGKILVKDSLDLERSYEAYREGSFTSLHEVVDAVTRVRGYAITVRVEGELDHADGFALDAVSGFAISMHRL